MPIYMKFEGIDGLVKGKYSKWIELDSAQIGPGQMSLNGTGKVKVSEMTITKENDSTSPSLMRQLVAGKEAKVSIVFLKSEKDEPYFKIDLEKVLIVSFNVSGKGGTRALELLSLNFTKITYEYSAGPNDPKGTATSVNVQTYGQSDP